MFYFLFLFVPPMIVVILTSLGSKKAYPLNKVNERQNLWWLLDNVMMAGWKGAVHGENISVRIEWKN